MKADDILKQLGFSDEELKSFFNKQKKYSEKVNKIKDYKDSFGITMHTPSYTPRTLVNRLSSMYVPEGRTSTDTELLKAGKKVSKLARDFDLFGKIEREQETELQSYEEGIPEEVINNTYEFLRALKDVVNSYKINTGYAIDTSEERARQLCLYNKNEIHSFNNKIMELTETYTRYLDFIKGDAMATAELQQQLFIAINEGLSIYEGSTIFDLSDSPF